MRPSCEAWECAMQRQRSAQRSCVFIIGAFLLGVLVTYTFVSKPVPSTTLPDTWHGSAGSSLRAQKMMLETTAKQNVVARKKLLAIVGVQVGTVLPYSPAQKKSTISVYLLIDSADSFCRQPTKAGSVSREIKLCINLKAEIALH